MTFPVFEGSNRDAHKAYNALWFGVFLGLSTYRIVLNGGSEERRDIREYWRDIARECGLTIEANGHSIVLRGPSTLL